MSWCRARGADTSAPWAIGADPGVSDPVARCLRAFAERGSDGVGGSVCAELGFQAREPVSDCVQAEAELPCDVRPFLDSGGGTPHLGLAWGEAKAIECVLTEARGLLLEQQRVRIAGQQVDGEAPPVSHAEKRWARRQSEPRGDYPRQPASVLGRPEVLAEPAISVEARALDLAIAMSSTTAVPGGGSIASARTSRSHASAYFDELATNVSREGVINKVKVITACAYGLSTFDGVRKRVVRAGG
jgi:hypothetical protein